MTLYHPRQNYYSWMEHQLSGAVLCSFCIIHLWSIAFCGEPSSYSPVMIAVLATLCICTVIQDVLISPKDCTLSHVHYINCYTSLPAMPLSILLHCWHSLPCIT